uniref:Uncharacterized protein n=1 Tax=Arundo donax TaxID=35708 RepID=A0A0A9TA11_ARUDO
MLSRLFLVCVIPTVYCSSFR